jgi:hypothetical protein
LLGGLYCGLSPDSPCRPYSMAAPYPPLVQNGILSN